MSVRKPSPATNAPAAMSSRDRMLAALTFRPSDYTPCCFMAWSALRARSSDSIDFLDRQLALGLDPLVRIPEIDVRMHPAVTTREWLSDAPPGEPYPVLHKEYATPAGKLLTSVNKSAEWPHGVHVPLWDDFLISHSRKFLVTPDDNLEALKYVLGRPTDADVDAFRRNAASLKTLASDRKLLTMAAYVMMGDMANWLAGLQPLMMATIDSPAFVRSLLDIIEEWNKPFIDLSLEAGADLVVRRGWYENADFWSPPMFRQFLLPSLARQADRVHRAGAKFGYLVSCSSMPLLDMMMEAGVDVLLGIDPAQDAMMDYPELKRKTAGKMALWGGVCGYLTMECGSPDDIRRQTRQAMRELAPGGGFILSPVTNIRDASDKAFANAQTLIDTWLELRTAPASL